MAANEPRLLQPWVAWTYLVGVVLVSCTSLLGLPTSTLFPGLCAAVSVAAAVGVQRNRPENSRPWYLLAVSGFVFLIAGALRETMGQYSGNLTDTRPLLPDLFTLIGMGLIGGALYGLLRPRNSAGRSSGSLLDAMLVSLGMLLLSWVVIIAPTFNRPDAWFFAQLSIVAFPPISAMFVALGCQLAFTAEHRSTSHRMLLIGLVLMLIGDVVVAMSDVGTMDAGRFSDLPYLLTAALFGAAALHPTMRHRSTLSESSRAGMTRGRLALVGATLVLPAVVASLVHPDDTGARVFVIAASVALAVAGVARILIAVRDQARAEAVVRRQALIDELTGLPNRTAVVNRLTQMLQRSEVTDGHVGVVHLDLDRFKLVNDSMGAAVGDEVLLASVERIRQHVRQTDVVARLSSDEFAILVQDLDEDAVYALAERVRNAFTKRLALSAGDVFVTASAGVALSSNRFHKDANDLLRDADTAMHHSKANGGNATTVFDTGMRERLMRRVELERALRSALDDGALHVEYQPLVELPSGAVIGFEALARWRSATGNVSPGEFIPVAEDSGLIVPLGAWVLDEACRQIAHWRRNLPGGENLTMSVNLSPRQIFETDVVELVRSALERWDLPGDALWLEITEGVMMEDTRETVSVLSRLRALGVRFSVDDFGTGFSSLAYLKRFPVNKVKIDRTFVKDLGVDRADESIVAGIVAMASALDLLVIAEGVETAEQAERLYQLGCQYAQGYLFAKPMLPEEIPAVATARGVAVATA